MCSTRCCALYSFTGILFLLFVYVLLSTQPFFVRGIDDVDRAKDSALGATFLFAALFLISLAGTYVSSGTEDGSDGGSGSGVGSGGRGGGGGYEYGRINVNLDYRPDAPDDVDYQLTTGNGSSSTAGSYRD